MERKDDVDYVRSCTRLAPVEGKAPVSVGRPRKI